MASKNYPGPTEPMLAAQLRLAAEAAHRALFSRLAERGFDGMRPSHFSLFRFPGPHGVRAGDLARRVGLSKQALNPLLNDLERSGYLWRAVDPTDQRGRTIWLTERGLGFVAAARDVLIDIERTAASRVGPRRFETFRQVLAELQDVVSPEGDPRLPGDPSTMPVLAGSSFKGPTKVVRESST